jgi:hypothetical protein
MREMVIFAAVCIACILVMAGIYTYIIKDDEASGND